MSNVADIASARLKRRERDAAAITAVLESPICTRGFRVLMERHLAEHDGTRPDAEGIRAVELVAGEDGRERVRIVFNCGAWWSADAAVCMGADAPPDFPAFARGFVVSPPPRAA